jgi:dTDP-4-amino-4,6-dideoxygalactose transaminase
MPIPVTKPYLGEEEAQAVTECLQSGWVVQGPRVAEFEQQWARIVGVDHATATTSCTTALHLALLGVGVKPGDEVIVPAFTWISTANAVEYCGARPVFVDIDLRTFNLDPAHVEDKITPRTKALLPVHQFGLSADMDALNAVARKYGLPVVEDAACACGTRYQGRTAGGLGDVGCFSFHPRKAITTGEGGMITTNDPDLAALFQVLRSHGAGESDLSRHQQGRFGLPQFSSLGFNYRMTDIQAAIGLSQLKKLEWVLDQRRWLAERYNDLIADIPFLQRPSVPAGYTHAYQSYVVLVDDQASLSRDEIARRLQSAQISARPGTVSIPHTAYYSQKYDLASDACPMSLKAEAQSMALPLYATMTETEQQLVVSALHEILT